MGGFHGGHHSGGHHSGRFHGSGRHHYYGRGYGYTITSYRFRKLASRKESAYIYFGLAGLFGLLFLIFFFFVVGFPATATITNVEKAGYIYDVYLTYDFEYYWYGQKCEGHGDDDYIHNIQVGDKYTIYAPIVGGTDKYLFEDENSMPLVLTITFGAVTAYNIIGGISLYVQSKVDERNAPPVPTTDKYVKKAEEGSFICPNCGCSIPKGSRYCPGCYKNIKDLKDVPIEETCDDVYFNYDQGAPCILEGRENEIQIHFDDE